MSHNGYCEHATVIEVRAMGICTGCGQKAGLLLSLCSQCAEEQKQSLIVTGKALSMAPKAADAWETERLTTAKVRGKAQRVPGLPYVLLTIIGVTGVGMCMSGLFDGFAFLEAEDNSAIRAVLIVSQCGFGLVSAACGFGLAKLIQQMSLHLHQSNLAEIAEKASST